MVLLTLCAAHLAVGLAVGWCLARRQARFAAESAKLEPDASPVHSLGAAALGHRQAEPGRLAAGEAESAELGFDEADLSLIHHCEERMIVATLHLQAQIGGLFRQLESHRRGADQRPAVDAEATAAAVAESPDPATTSHAVDPPHGEPIRYGFHFPQLVAPCTEQGVVAAEGFREVMFYDISTRGFSFVARQPPDYEHLLVGLGRPPRIKYYRGQVVHVEPLADTQDDAFLVSCRFIGRVSCPLLPQRPALPRNACGEERVDAASIAVSAGAAAGSWPGRRPAPGGRNEQLSDAIDHGRKLERAGASG
jgi:hypothetical protein